MRSAMVFIVMCVTAVMAAYKVTTASNNNVSCSCSCNFVNKPKNCLEAKRYNNDSGAVLVYPQDDNTPIQVYCDQDTDGGGWLVFQRRQDGSVDFYRNWTEYQNGFGDVTREFWLGLDALHTLTSGQTYTLRVDLTKWNLEKGYATYSNFSISGSSDNYRLHFDRFTVGNAGDSLTYHNNMQFSTAEADHDIYSRLNCARRFHGAWWYQSCHDSNLNGVYNSSRAYGEAGAVWSHFDDYYSLKFSEMKFKPM